MTTIDIQRILYRTMRALKMGPIVICSGHKLAAERIYESIAEENKVVAAYPSGTDGIVITHEMIKFYMPYGEGERDNFMVWTSSRKYIKGQLIFRRIHEKA